MERWYTYGAVPRTALDVTIDADDPAVVLDDPSGWPDTGPFTITVERDTVNEERILIASRSGSTLTVASSGRGRDGTTARAHTAGSTTYVEHTLSAELIDEMNDALALQTTKGDLLAHNGTALVRKAVGTNGLPLVARSTDSTGVAYEQVGTTGVADLAITTAKLADDSVTSAKIVAGTIGPTDIADDAIQSQHYGDATIGTAALGLGQVTGPNIANDTITLAKMATSAKELVDWAYPFASAYTSGETTLATFTIPAGLLATGSTLILDADTSMGNGLGGTYAQTIRFRMNGTLMFTWTLNMPTLTAYFFRFNIVWTITNLVNGLWTQANVIRSGNKVAIVFPNLIAGSSTVGDVYLGYGNFTGIDLSGVGAHSLTITGQNAITDGNLTCDFYNGRLWHYPTT